MFHSTGSFSFHLNKVFHMDDYDWVIRCISSVLASLLILLDHIMCLIPLLSCLFLKGIHHGRALLRVSINSSPLKSDYVLVTASSFSSP